MPRSARCNECGEVFEVQTTKGPLPGRCASCGGGRRRVKANARSAYRSRIAEIDTLRARVTELEALIARQGGKRRHVSDPGRRTLARCVRRVAYAEGREGTIARLLDLRDAAEAWAAMLAAREPVDDDVTPESEPTVVRTELGDVVTGPDLVTDGPAALREAAA